MTSLDQISDINGRAQSHGIPQYWYCTVFQFLSVSRAGKTVSFYGIYKEVDLCMGLKCTCLSISFNHNQGGRYFHRLFPSHGFSLTCFRISDLWMKRINTVIMTSPRQDLINSKVSYPNKNPANIDLHCRPSDPLVRF